MPLTHFDAEGKARMVDVTEKKETVPPFFTDDSRHLPL